MARSRLQAVGDDETLALVGQEVPAATAPHRNPAQAVLTELLITSLRALSQRTVVALASLVDFALIASVFVLWIMIIKQPSIEQLMAAGGYALFILASVWARNRA